MPRDEYETVLGYLNPRTDNVSLLGGEPTLHRHFEEFVSIAATRGFLVNVFSNGTGKSLQRVLAGSLRKHIKVVLNLNPPEQYSLRELETIYENCRLAGRRMILSYNLYTPEFRWDFIRNTIMEYKLKPLVRLGLAQPIQGEANACLSENQMSALYDRITQMASELAIDGIRMGFDCGFRLCGFTVKQRGILASCGTDMNFICGPTIDIGPGLQVWRCFPMSTTEDVHRRLTEFSSLNELREFYTEQWATEQALGNTSDCPDCPERWAGVCRGGCLSRTLILKGARHDSSETE